LAKMVLLVLGFGALAPISAAVALAAGGKSVSSAPELPLATQVGGGGKIVGSQRAGSCSGYGEFWRLSLAKGDRVSIAYGSRNGLEVRMVLMDPSVTDTTFNQSGPLENGSTFAHDRLTYVAAKAGRYTVGLYTGYPCQPSLAYTLTADVRHTTHATLTRPAVAHIHAPVTLTGRVAGLSSGRVALQSNTKAGWKTIKTTAVQKDGSFAFMTQFDTPGARMVRAVYAGDSSHLGSNAVVSIRVA
jgi:hypothetical protein